MSHLNRCLQIATVLALLARPIAAQQGSSDGRPLAVRLGAMGVAVVSRLSPAILDSELTEAYLTQPMALAAVSSGRLTGFLTLNAEGATLRRGELNPGVYGEGYVDRRHPHTYLHELMLGWRDSAARLDWSVYAGKGFVPFGSDDPMGRPFVKYPVNHHLAQILERVTANAAVRSGRLMLEGALFGGDEPESPGDWPSASRGLDSWAARLTGDLTRGVAVSMSLARVESPELASGGGLDQSKAHAALRVERTGRLRYALIEAARTRELLNEATAFAYRSYLAEGLWSAGGIDVALRLERTERPEEERAASLYRTVRPHHDFHTLGTTRWTNASVGVSARPVSGLRPFVEVAWHSPKALRIPTALDPAILFGSTRITMLSVGARLHVGSMRSRFGPYGTALADRSPASAHVH